MTLTHDETLWKRPRYPEPGRCFVCGKAFCGLSHLCHEHRDFMIPKRVMMDLVPLDVSPLQALELLDYYNRQEYGVHVCASGYFRFHILEDVDDVDEKASEWAWAHFNDIDWDVEIMMTDPIGQPVQVDIDGNPYDGSPEALRRSFARDIIRDMRPKPRKGQMFLEQFGFSAPATDAIHQDPEPRSPHP